MGKKWIPLEANPEVLNEYAQKIGVSGTSYVFTDVYGLDEVRAGRGVGIWVAASEQGRCRCL
jgi:hypothetical protein